MVLQVHHYIFPTPSDTFTIQGEIKYKKTGTIYLTLVTGEDFKNADAYQMIWKKEIKEKPRGWQSIPFEFKNVKPGVFALKCFMDRNGNEKLDIGSFGPKEPWGMYRKKRPLFRAPKWKEIAFELKKDLKKIRIKIK
jgi:uncharacterized protein (DUF2141 family)